MHGVSNRHISEAAGQGNNAAACYHFGSRADLLRAIEARHRAAIDEIRQRELASIPSTPQLRDWIGVLVYPLTEHLEALGTTTSYARFAAQVMADPTCRDLVGSDAMTSELMLKTVRGINRSLPDHPKRVRAGRWMMARNLLMHSLAEIEGEHANTRGTTGPNWPVVAEELVTALVGLWEAPVARREGARRDVQVRVSSVRSG
ncbi:TetR family transcriptional regulator [Mycolicibacterium helvum]|uniref:TetR family transcriptional regulator n=2 Tax=Mycolicibacterium helvum TaxID=1534349 RepID=A0A7I7T3K4_9MYCO|nr:TetR family transcriptional regulator [Mycolicibacterium helvum]